MLQYGEDAAIPLIGNALEFVIFTDVEFLKRPAGRSDSDQGMVNQWWASVEFHVLIASKGKRNKKGHKFLGIRRKIIQARLSSFCQ
jgi:hypothetical protein